MGKAGRSSRNVSRREPSKEGKKLNQLLPTDSPLHVPAAAFRLTLGLAWGGEEAPASRSQKGKGGYSKRTPLLSSISQATLRKPVTGKPRVVGLPIRLRDLGHIQHPWALTVYKGRKLYLLTTMIIFQYLKKHKELIPLAMIMSATFSGMVFTGINALRRPDVIIDKWNNPEPWDKLDPTKPRKLISIHQQWKPIEELEEIRKLTKG